MQYIQCNERMFCQKVVTNPYNSFDKHTCVLGVPERCALVILFNRKEIIYSSTVTNGIEISTLENGKRHETQLIKNSCMR